MFKSIKKRLSKDPKKEKADGSPGGADAAGAAPAAPGGPGGAGGGDGDDDSDGTKSGRSKGTASEKKKTLKKERGRKGETGGSAGGLSGLNTDLLPDLPEATVQDLLKPQASFNGLSYEDKTALFVRKVRLCCIMFHFDASQDANAPARPAPAGSGPFGERLPTPAAHASSHPQPTASGLDPRDELRAKEAKRQLLLELVDLLQKQRSHLTEPVAMELVRMVSINLFRALPVKTRDPIMENEEDEPQYDPAWPHLQIVYELFLRFIVSDVDMRVLKKVVNSQFVLHLLELFDSEDPRERDYLKTILHRIYAKFMSLRAYIRKAINNTFYTFIYESQRHAGTAELLEILGSIINGFALPLKDEHKFFLQRVLLPMHKVRPLPHFHQQLSYCVTQFVNKEAELAVPVLQGLIKLWPVTNSAKEVLFIGELEEVLELTQAEQFRAVMVPLFKQVAKSIGSPHFQVAERALFLWHNEYISSLIADHKDTILPILYPVLSHNSQKHWNPTVTNLTVNVLKIFMEMDSVLVQECSKRLAEEEKQREERIQQRALMWKRLESAQARPGAMPA